MRLRTRKVKSTPVQLESDSDSSETSSRNKNIYRNSRVFRCRLCEFQTKWQINFTRHKRVHTKERPYHCHVCSASFGRNYVLQNHIRARHIKDLKYHCSKCYRRFPTASVLNTHMSSIHPPSTPFSCPKCPKQLSRKGLLNVHLKYVHGPKIHNCSTCNVQFSTITHLNAHFRRKCHRAAQILANLMASKTLVSVTNINLQWDDLFPNEIEIVELSQEQSRGDNEKPHECPVCQRSFRTIDKLGRHMSRKHKSFN